MNDDEGVDQFSVIFEQLLNLNELSFEAISSYHRSNAYLYTKEGIKDFISTLPYIVEFRSPSINLLAKIVKDFINSFDDEDTRNDIKKQIFYSFYHLPSKSPSKLFSINYTDQTNYNPSISIPKSFSNAFFFRCLYDFSIYTIYEIANLIHQYWEIDSVVSSKSYMVKYTNKLPLISLFVWFAPEIDFVNNSFFNLLCKIAKKEMFSRNLPKSYNQFIENIDKYRENGCWSFFKEMMKQGENENEVFRYIKLDDSDSLRNFYYNKIQKSNTKPTSKNKNDKFTSNNYIVNLNNSIESHLFNSHWILQYSPTPLHIAAFFGASECIEFLLSEVIDQNGLKKKDKMGLDVVDFAGVGGNAEVIKALRNHGCDVQRSIHTSILFHHNHLADFISREFGLNLKTFYPEMCASNNIYAFKNTKKITNEENTIDLESLVEISSRFGSFLLLRNGLFDLTKPLLEMCLLTATKFSNLRFIESLLSYVKKKNLSIPEEFDINKVNEDGETALQVAVGISDENIARTLILSKEIFEYDFKINLNAKLPSGGESLLHTCVLLNSIGIAKILLNCKDFDVNLTDCNGATALHYASRCVNTIGTHLVVDLSIVKEEFVRKPENYIFSYGKFINLEMFQLFVREKRVNFNVFDNYGLAPLHYIAKGGRVDYIFDIKLNRMIKLDDPESPIPPSESSYFKYVQRESQNYNNIIMKSTPSNNNDNNNNINNNNNNNANDTNDNNTSTLNSKDTNTENQKESQEGKVFISDVDFRIKSKIELKNPLHFSAENDRVCNCSALLSFVSDSLNDRDINGRTPIQLACAAGCVDCIRYLLEFATPETINSTDKWKKTALHISSSKGRTGCVRQLAQLENIDLNCRDSFGNTALRLADNHLYYLTSQLLEFVNAEK